MKCPDAQVLDFVRRCAGRLCVLVQPCTATCSHEMTELCLAVHSLNAQCEYWSSVHQTARWLNVHHRDGYEEPVSRTAPSRTGTAASVQVSHSTEAAVHGRYTASEVLKYSSQPWTAQGNEPSRASTGTELYEVLQEQIVRAVDCVGLIGCVALQTACIEASVLRDTTCRRPWRCIAS